jgi:hypothetical protein
MQTKIIGGGTGVPGLGQELAVDPTFLAARVALRPLEYASQGTVLGHFRATVITGTTVSIGAKGILSYLRWTASSYAVIERLTLNSAYVASTITTGVIVDAAAYIRRGSTAAGSGGNAVTIGGNNQKMRASMGASLVTDMRVATTGALTAPTNGTQDANPIGYTLTPSTFVTTAPVSGTPATATLGIAPVDLFKWDALGAHPPVLVAGESVEFVEYTAGPATGGIAFAMTYEWAEVVLF